MPLKKKYFSSSCSKSAWPQAWTLLEHDDGMPGSRQFARHDTAGRSGTDHDEIHRLAGLEGASAHARPFISVATNPG